jgi:hypothetical protein
MVEHVPFPSAMVSDILIGQGIQVERRHLVD